MNPKIYLIGYPGSQKIVPASKYLTAKYLPGFSVTYLNYRGEINGWSTYIANFLLYLTDEYVIFALDDYLLSSPIDMGIFNDYALGQIGGDVVCVKLCKSTHEEHIEYPATTQYTLWNREYLISLLLQVRSPWSFEIDGSNIFKQSSKKVLLCTCLDYFCNSSISNRWEGINTTGLKNEDLKYLKKNNLLPNE